MPTHQHASRRARSASESAVPTQEAVPRRRRANSTALAQGWAAALQSTLRADVPDSAVIRVGVSFRTDQRGGAHSGYDVRAFEAAEQIYPGHRAVTQALPRGASGGDTPPREANWEDLDEIDLIFIPGAPMANSTQVATSSDAAAAAEEEGVSRPRNARERTEHESRSAYELRLIAMARTRGIPVLAVCAGSWRLLEAYNGVVRTLPVGQRGRHKARPPTGAWDIGHGVEITRRSLLHDLIGRDHLSGTNSTHWAVAAETPAGRLRRNALGGEDPSDMIDVMARTTGSRPELNTVEGFGSRSGVPHIGAQWHPETYLPGMPGYDAAHEAQRSAAAGLFRGMFEAAGATRARRTVVRQLDRRFFGRRLNAALGLRDDETGSQVYDELAQELGRPPTEADIRDHLARFNIGDF